MPKNSRANMRTGPIKGGIGTICLKKRRRPLRKLLSMLTVIRSAMAVVVRGESFRWQEEMASRNMMKRYVANTL